MVRLVRTKAKEGTVDKKSLLQSIDRVFEGWDQEVKDMAFQAAYHNLPIRLFFACSEKIELYNRIEK